MGIELETRTIIWILAALTVISWIIIIYLCYFITEKKREQEGTIYPARFEKFYEEFGLIKEIIMNIRELPGAIEAQRVKIEFLKATIEKWQAKTADGNQANQAKDAEIEALKAQLAQSGADLANAQNVIAANEANIQAIQAQAAAQVDEATRKANEMVAAAQAAIDADAELASASIDRLVVANNDLGATVQTMDAALTGS